VRERRGCAQPTRCAWRLPEALDTVAHTQRARSDDCDLHSPQSVRRM